MMIRPSCSGTLFPFQWSAQAFSGYLALNNIPIPSSRTADFRSQFQRPSTIQLLDVLAKHLILLKDVESISDVSSEDLVAGWSHGIMFGLGEGPLVVHVLGQDMISR